MLWTLTGLTLGLGATIGLVHVGCRLIALRFQDAPDRDPYLTKLLREIEATRETGFVRAGGKGAGTRADRLGTHNTNDGSHCHRDAGFSA